MAGEAVNYRAAERFFQDQRDTLLNRHIESLDEEGGDDEDEDPDYINPCGTCPCRPGECKGYGTGFCPPEIDDR